ncbi:MAG: hypothetical protein N2383_12190 [Caldilineales bacterium]|nr:hypothetical protein [Caldilineales bacterium]
MIVSNRDAHAPQGQVLTQNGNQHLVGGRQRVDGEQSQAGAAVNHDEIVMGPQGFQNLLQQILTADLGDQLDLGAG